MLSELLRLLEEQRGGLGLTELSNQLGMEPGAVDGMLQMLVQRGRVIVVGADGGVCASCGVQEQCNLLATHQTRYVVVPRSGRVELGVVCG
jgi:Mn-dependent DtxR family transcriptional regulator